MYATVLRCRSCGEEHPLNPLYSCQKCGGILEVCYDYDSAFVNFPVRQGDNSRHGLWKYQALLPVKQGKNIVSLGEGDTPLLDAPLLTEFWRCNLNLYIKAESFNPSGSFKDRPTSVGVSVAKEQGASKIVVASTGNAASSAAAYAARGGMSCVVFIPEGTDPSKTTQAQAYGAEVYSVPGTFSDAYAMAEQCAARYNWVNVTSTYVNPYTLEGNKTISYELFHQLKEAVPDYIFVPIGAGPLLTGVYKGYLELKSMSLISKLPKMIGVQAGACAPITEAFVDKSEAVTAWKNPIKTIAGGIADPLIGYPENGTLTLQTVNASGGAMVSLTEEEISEGMTAIERKLGVYCEPAAAVSVAAVKKLFDEGTVSEGATVVSLLTGSGFKYGGRKFEKPQLVTSLESFQALLGL